MVCLDLDFSGYLLSENTTTASTTTTSFPFEFPEKLVSILTISIRLDDARIQRLVSTERFKVEMRWGMFLPFLDCRSVRVDEEQSDPSKISEGLCWGGCSIEITAVSLHTVYFAKICVYTLRLKCALLG